MLKEAVEALDVQAEATYVDTTFGRGGHARRILDSLSPQGNLIAFDKDPQAVETAQALGDPRLQIRHQGFAALNQLPPNSVKGVLMDLGVSSPQIDNPQRGFSFRQDGPLDMRMDSSKGQSVYEWLAHAKTEQIAEVIRDLGEERFANGVAKAITAKRDAGQLPDTTLGMAALSQRWSKPESRVRTLRHAPFKRFVCSSTVSSMNCSKRLMPACMYSHLEGVWW